eukprot:m.239186 g.239186  ORF g.239186 m.239186 type:complete len:1154 (+) comp22372_c0_seq1:12-3473(+)
MKKGFLLPKGSGAAKAPQSSSQGGSLAGAATGSAGAAEASNPTNSAPLVAPAAMAGSAPAAPVVVVQRSETREVVGNTVRTTTTVTTTTTTGADAAAVAATPVMVVRRNIQHGDTPPTVYHHHTPVNMRIDVASLFTPSAQAQAALLVSGTPRAGPIPFSLNATNGARAGAAAVADEDVPDSWEDNLEPPKLPPPKISAAPVASSITSTSLHLTWVPDEYSGAITRYTVHISTKDATGKAREGEVYTGPDTECDVTDLAPGTDATFTVRAHTDTEAGPASPSLVTQTLATIPATPLAPELSGRTKTSLSLKWSAVTMTGGRPIVRYELVGDNGDGSLAPDAFPILFSGTERRFKTASTLSPGTIYRFAVRAVNAVGPSALGPLLAAATTLPPPQRPPQPTAIAVMANSILISWNDPDGTARADDVTYTLEMDDPSNGYGYRSTYNGPETGHLCLGLRGRTKYRFRVSATNAQGTSPVSAVLEVTTRPTVPAAPPVPVVAGRPSSRSMEVSWTIVVAEQEEPVTYTLMIRRDGQRDFTPAFRGALGRCEISGLEPGTEYHLCVHGTNSGGDGPLSPILIAHTQPEAPSAPTALALAPAHLTKAAAAAALSSSALLAGAVAVTWTAPSFVGGAPITSYKVYARAAESEDEWHACWEGKQTSASILGLLPATRFDLRVCALNRAGEGASSHTITITSPDAIPAAPQNLALVTAGASTLSVSWTAPRANGPAITGYRVEISENVLGPADSFKIAATTENTTCDLRGLNPITAYAIRVAATNKIGLGLFSDALVALTAPGAPQAPTGVSISEITQTSATVSWTAATARGSPVTQYRVFANTLSFTTQETECSLPLTGLDPDTTYRVKVQALSRCGDGPFSSVVKLVTSYTTPQAPSIDCTVGNGFAKLTWASDKRSTVDYSELEMAEGDGDYVQVYSGPLSTFKASRLSPDTTYLFRVRDVNSYGVGLFSPSVRATIPLAPVPVPTLTVTFTPPAAATLAWNTKGGGDTVELHAYTRAETHTALQHNGQTWTLTSDYSIVWTGPASSTPLAVNVIAPKPGLSMCFRVRVRDTATERWSPFSMHTDLRVPLPAPPTPTPRAAATPTNKTPHTRERAFEQAKPVVFKKKTTWFVVPTIPAWLLAMLFVLALAVMGAYSIR